MYDILSQLGAMRNTLSTYTLELSSIFLPSLIVEYGCMVYIMHMILISDKAYTKCKSYILLIAKIQQHIVHPLKMTISTNFEHEVKV